MYCMAHEEHVVDSANSHQSPPEPAVFALLYVFDFVDGEMLGGAVVMLRAGAEKVIVGDVEAVWTRHRLCVDSLAAARKTTDISAEK